MSNRSKAIRASFALGRVANLIGYGESSASLLSRTAAIVVLRGSSLSSTPSNVDAYLRGVASKLIARGT